MWKSYNLSTLTSVCRWESSNLSTLTPVCRWKSCNFSTSTPVSNWERCSFYNYTVCKWMQCNLNPRHLYTGGSDLIFPATPACSWRCCFLPGSGMKTHSCYLSAWYLSAGADLMLTFLFICLQVLSSFHTDIVYDSTVVSIKQSFPYICTQSHTALHCTAHQDACVRTHTHTHTHTDTHTHTHSLTMPL